MKRTLLCLCLLLPYGCGVGQKITALVGDPPNEANLPAPLIEFTDSVDVTKIWSKNIGAGTDGQYLKLSPAIAGERVFITDSNGKLRALSADSGKPVWDNDTKLPITGGMGAGQTLVLAGTREEKSSHLTLSPAMNYGVRRSQAKSWRLHGKPAILSLSEPMTAKYLPSMPAKAGAYGPMSVRSRP